jgi:MraZ protein
MWEERRGVLGFCGSFTCTIDDKGRLSIPAKIRPGDPDSSQRKGIPAGEELVLTEGLDGCLMLYTMKGWEDYKALIGNMASTQKRTRYFNRRLYQNTSLVRIDRSGRINIPEKLRLLVGLGKSVLVIGVDQTIEIWAPERYQAYLDNFGQTYEEVAEELRGDE